MTFDSVLPPHRLFFQWWSKQVTGEERFDPLPGVLG